MTGESHEKISMDNNSRIADLERQMRQLTELVAKTASHCEASGKKTDDLHRQFLERSASGEPPLAERIYKAVKAYENTSWVGKTALWGVLTLGSLAAAFAQITKWLQGMGKG